MKKLKWTLLAIVFIAGSALMSRTLWAEEVSPNTNGPSSGPNETSNILLVNDDGIDTDGIAALAKSLSKLGTVYVCAPDGNRSGASHSVTTASTPMRLTERKIPFAKEAWALDGTPVDCATYGLLKLANGHFDLLVSGINKGNNVGEVAHYSGTIGAAVEGALRDVPSIAVSAGYKQTDWEACAGITSQVAKKLLDGNGAKHVVYSINVPDGEINENTLVVATPMGGLYFTVRDITEQKVDTHNDSATHSKDICILLGTDASNAPANSDTAHFLAGKVTITPLSIDWTAREALDEIRSWQLALPATQ